MVRPARDARHSIVDGRHPHCNLVAISLDTSSSPLHTPANAARAPRRRRSHARTTRPTARPEASGGAARSQPDPGGLQQQRRIICAGRERRPRRPRQRARRPRRPLRASPRRPWRSRTSPSRSPTATTPRCSPRPRPPPQPGTRTHRLRREPGPCRPGEAAPGRDSVGQVRRDHHPAAVRRRDGRGRQEGHRRRDRGRQHRPGPRFRHDHRELAGRGPELERRLRPERARTQDRRARRRGLRRPRGQPVQRRLHLVGQGGRPRHRAQGSVRHRDREPSRDQGRVRQR